MLRPDYGLGNGTYPPRGQTVAVPQAGEKTQVAQKRRAATRERVVPGAGKRILRLVELDFEQQSLNQIHQRRTDLSDLVLPSFIRSASGFSPVVKRIS